MSTPRTVLFAVVVAMGSLGGGVAVADGPAGTGYSCDALTSASVPAVKKRLSAQGLDLSGVTGPIGLSCRRSAGDGDGVAAAVTGIDGVAFHCADAEEKSGPKIVFFVDCGGSTGGSASGESVSG
jgi:hypothetical protein